MDTHLSILKAVEDLLDILHSKADELEFLFCAVNDTVNWEIRPEALQCFELSLYKGKNTQITTENKSFKLNQSCLTLFDINKGYKVEMAGGSYNYITFRLADLNNVSTPLPGLKKVCSVLEQGIRLDDYSVVERLFYEIHREFLLKKPYYKRKTSLLIQDMLILLLRMYKQICIENRTYDISHKYAQISDRVLIYLESNYTEPVKLQDIAAFTGYTPRYIDTIFKQATGFTIIHYLTKIRIESSRKALLSSRKAITEIALDCGFDSSSYFCKVFKKATGLSPSEFREGSSTNIS